MGIFTIIGNLLGIGKDYLNNRQKIKEAKQQQEYKIVEAETKAIVDRIMSNTESDNEIDLITARNKKYTSKDEFITYLFLVPVIIATVTPFIIAYKNDKWEQLNILVQDSYHSLDGLPNWYKYILFLVVTDVLGFRSFLRKVSERVFNKYKVNKDDK